MPRSQSPSSPPPHLSICFSACSGQRLKAGEWWPEWEALVTSDLWLGVWLTLEDTAQQWEARALAIVTMVTQDLFGTVGGGGQGQSLVFILICVNHLLPIDSYTYNTYPPQNGEQV